MKSAVGLSVFCWTLLCRHSWPAGYVLPASYVDVQESGDFKFVKAAVSAKDFDKAITVEIEGVGSVTDSAEASTARVGSGENVYKLTQALRAYGADAKRFAEATSGT